MAVFTLDSSENVRDSTCENGIFARTFHHEKDSRMVNITDAHKNLNYAHGSVCVGMIV